MYIILLNINKSKSKYELSVDLKHKLHNYFHYHLQYFMVQLKLRKKNQYLESNPVLLSIQI